MVKIKYIPNEDLELDKIPNPDNESFDFEGHPFESQLGWQRFALTIDGYNVAGGLEACSKCVSQVLSEKEKATLTQMRCALFLIQRHVRWAYNCSPQEPRAKAVVRLIREKVKKGELE